MLGIFFWFGWTKWIDKPEPTIQAAIATATATGIVGWFGILAVFYAKRETDIGKEAIENALNAERNAAMPIIAIENVHLGINTTRLVITYKNISAGVALNLYRQEEAAEPEYLRPALAAQDFYSFTLPSQSGDFTIGITYSDIYERQFESIFAISQEEVTNFEHLQLT